MNSSEFIACQTLVSQPPAPEAEYTTEQRREFLKQAASAFGVTLCAGTLASLMNACETTTVKPTGAQVTLNVAQEAALQNTGGAISRRFDNNNGGRNVIIVRLSTTEFVALSAVCTHAQCDVNLPNRAGGDLVCPCHGSRFSSRDGSVLSAPASSALPRFTTAFNASSNVLTITF